MKNLNRFHKNTERCIRDKIPGWVMIAVLTNAILLPNELGWL